ncbi:MAG: lipoprotein signal peptidase [Burkholderiales bacterium]|nr:lipoprotein signal peptidase [Burkholderiales bacterium]
MATRSLSRSAGSSPSMWLWLALALVVVLLDQFAKALIVRDFQIGDSRTVASFFDLVRYENTGMAWSLLEHAGGWQRWFFIGLAIAASAFMAYLLRRNGAQRLFSFAIAMVMGGAIGNVIDRIARGAVVDFISLHWHRAYTFPAFNLADSAITLGAICLLVDELLRVRRG